MSDPGGDDPTANQPDVERTDTEWPDAEWPDAGLPNLSPTPEPDVPPGVVADLRDFFLAMFADITNTPRTTAPGTATDMRSLLDRHGLPDLAAATAWFAQLPVRQAAYRRRASVETVVADYLGHLSRSLDDHTRADVRRHMLNPECTLRANPADPEQFVMGLAAMHMAAVMELAGHPPLPRATP